MTKSWYPLILGQMCNGCMACIEYCERDVYSEVKTGDSTKVRAEKRENCLENCKECAQYCTFGAIVFPDQYEEYMEKNYVLCSCGGHLMEHANGCNCGHHHGE